MIIKEEIVMDYRNNNQTNRVGSSDLSRHFTFVYGWMFLGLVVSGIMSIITLISPIGDILYSNKLIFIGAIISEFIVVIYLSSRIMKLNYSQAAGWFLFYSILNGMTISFIFLIYNMSSIILAFFMAASFFGFMSIYGLTTKADLSSWGNLLFVGLIAVIITMVVNIFIGSSTITMIISFVGVGVFLGLTAYDNQKIKSIYNRYQNTDKEKNIAVFGALTLYLDFINLFLFVLRILGRRN
jgi:FtsH-binding integral membrane protein